MLIEILPTKVDVVYNTTAQFLKYPFSLPEFLLIFRVSGWLNLILIDIVYLWDKNKLYSAMIKEQQKFYDYNNMRKASQLQSMLLFFSLTIINSNIIKVLIKLKVYVYFLILNKNAIYL